MAWKNGSQDAFNALFQKYYEPLCHYAYSFIRDKEAAKDLVQQVFTGILAGRLYLHLDTGVKSYLYTSVHNRCLRELDNRKRHKFHLTRFEQTIPLAESPDFDMEDEQMSHHTALKELIAGLPKQRRTAIELFYLEGHKQVDVARKMGIALSSVKTHLQLALVTLREKLHNS